jgi:TonB family protein
MNATNEIHIDSVLKKQIQDVQQLAKTGQFSKALNTIKSAKAIYPKNIFFIALEKQLEKLLALTYGHDLSDPERQKELSDSIPVLVQRAVAAMEKEDPVVPVAQPTVNTGEREEAVTKLKDEYFQRADNYVHNGEYNNALQEIGRVLILDPEDTMAKEYQKKVHEFIELQRKPEPEPIGTPEPVQQKKEEPTPAPPVANQPREKVVAETAPTVHKEAPKPVVPETKLPAKPTASSSRKMPVVVGIIAAVVVLGTAAFFIRPTGSESNATPNTSSPSANQIATGANVVAKEPPEPVATIPVPEQNKDNAQIPAPMESQSSDNPPTQVEPTPTTNKKETSDVLPSKDENSARTLPTSNPAGKGERITNEYRRPRVKPEAIEPVQETKIAKAEEVHKDDSKATLLAKAEPKPEVIISTEAPPSAPVHLYQEKMPSVIRLVNPEFPPAAIATGLEGNVIVKVQINPEGKPIQAKIVKSNNDLFNQAVIQAAMKSEYSPGVMPSGPVTTWLTIPFKFRLN